MNHRQRQAAMVRGLLLLAPLLATACSVQLAPSVQIGDRPVIALPAHNRTGDELLVSGDSLLNKYFFHAPKVTVGEVLAAESRFQLSERGIHVVPSEEIESATKGRVPGSPHAALEIASKAGLRGLVLYMDISHWEADAPTHPAFVIVGLSANLIDASGKTLWQFDRPALPIATPGETSAETAYETAARKVVGEMLDRLVPAVSK
jgi:hypothetical protein